MLSAIDGNNLSEKLYQERDMLMRILQRLLKYEILMVCKLTELQVMHVVKQNATLLVEMHKSLYFLVYNILFLKFLKADQDIPRQVFCDTIVLLNLASILFGFLSSYCLQS